MSSRVVQVSSAAKESSVPIRRSGPLIPAEIYSQIAVWPEQGVSGLGAECFGEFDRP